MALARQAAARSALTLSGLPVSSSAPSGEMTGTVSALMICSMASSWQLTASPTRPMSTCWPSSSVAWILRPVKTSVPGMPCALPPNSVIIFTSPGLMVWLRVCSTMVMASGVVTRKPPMNFASRPASFIAAEMALPPPCTITGLMPATSRKTISRMTLRTRPGSSMAEPPILIRKVWPRNDCR